MPLYPLIPRQFVLTKRKTENAFRRYDYIVDSINNENNRHERKKLVWSRRNRNIVVDLVMERFIGAKPYPHGIYLISPSFGVIRVDEHDALGAAVLFLFAILDVPTVKTSVTSVQGSARNGRWSCRGQTFVPRKKLGRITVHRCRGKARRYRYVA